MQNPKYEVGQEFDDFIVHGILTPELYVGSNSGKNFEAWNEYKNWVNRYIYYVKLHIPSKPYTIEELQKYFPEKNYTEIEFMYNTTPSYSILAMPEEALDNIKEKHETIPQND